MPQDKPSAHSLTRDIFHENPSLDAPIQDVVKRVRDLRACGLPDENVKKTVTKMFDIKTEVDARENETREPDADEILVYSLPDEFYRDLHDFR